MSELLDEMISEMVTGSALSVVRHALEEAECGYPLGDTRDVADALRSIRYLGPAVHAIFGSAAVSERVKIEVAKRYLRVVVLHTMGRIPDGALEGGYFDEPSFTLEAAALLASRGEYDWSDEEMMRMLLFYASPRRFAKTAVETKRAFLSLLIDRLNSDGALAQRFSSVPLHQDEIARMSIDEMPYSHDPLGLEKLTEGKRTLLQNIMPLLDSDYNKSSFSLVCRLSCMDEEDLENFFLDMSVLFWRYVPNAVLAFQDLAVGLSGRGIAALRLMRSVVEMGSRDKGHHVDEQRVKALVRVAERAGECDAEFVGLIRRVLGWHMETDSRLLLFKLVYGKTRDKRIIDEALRFESRKIRKWAEEQKRLAPAGRRRPRIEAQRRKTVRIPWTKSRKKQRGHTQRKLDAGGQAS